MLLSVSDRQEKPKTLCFPLFKAQTDSLWRRMIEAKCRARRLRCGMLMALFLYCSYLEMWPKAFSLGGPFLATRTLATVKILMFL